MITVESIRDCLEGFVPAVMATSDPDGVPNVSLLSQVHFVDAEHVALSYQFFNKTRRNILATRIAAVQVTDPKTLSQYRLKLEYLETQTEGPLFESMKAKLAGIASHSGMEGVFRLLGSDLCRVLAIETAIHARVPPAPPPRNLLSAARQSCDRLAACADLSELFDRTLACLSDLFGIDHAMLLMLDAPAGRLYTVASHGYASSGIGSEVLLGEGVIGVAAREGVPIRIAHMTSEYSYSRAIRDSAARAGAGSDGSWAEATEIPFPGLPQPHSQIAVPILARGKVMGVLFAESPSEMRFWYDDEDALAAVARQLGAMIALVQQDEDAGDRALAAAPTQAAPAAPVLVRRFTSDGSIFLGHDYLIKGVAGAIFWKLVREYVAHGRVEFTNRELRLDPEIRLPEFAENLEARLILLQRRLVERNACIRLEKAGRGRFRLAVEAALTLQDGDGPGA